ncbi:MAG: hypothetical protein MRQ13_03100 [Candidatus Midichloria sp.]|nr:hypothetical protein [Candidatus Midichloria sp.]
MLLIHIVSLPVTFAQSNICPRDLLLDWIEHNVRIIGNKGVLRIMVNSATLQRSKVKRKMEIYHGLYDVTLRLLSDEKWPDSYIELMLLLKILALCIVARATKKKQQLLQNTYFSDYLIK